MTQTALNGRTSLAEYPGIPEEFAAKYRAAGYWIDETFQDFLLDRCARFADRTALVARSSRDPETGSLATRRWTYAHLEDEARRSARTLRDLSLIHI